MNLALLAACIGLGAIVGFLVWKMAALRSRLRDAEVQVQEFEDRMERRRLLEGRLSQALDAVPWGVVLSASDGSVVFRNGVAEGFSSARHSAALVEAAIRELLIQARSGLPDEREIEVVGPPFRSYIVRSFPLRSSSGDTKALIGSLVLVEDITERRRLDQIRRDFVANISHELRTPVGALGLLAETIQDEPEIETVRRLSNRMVAEADRVANTIEDLQELSRIEFGEETTIDDLEVAPLLAEALSRIAAAAELRAVKLETVCSSRSVVQGDRRQLVSAIYNLVDNAVKYSPVGGTVELELCQVAEGVRISVTDHGPGIPDKELDRIFERFYRVDRARSRETGGTGLGLSIVRHVAANHGGEVAVTSQEGVGSTFSLRLPSRGASPENPCEKVDVKQ